VKKGRAAGRGGRAEGAERGGRAEMSGKHSTRSHCDEK